MGYIVVLYAYTFVGGYDPNTLDMTRCHTASSTPTAKQDYTNGWRQAGYPITAVPYCFKKSLGDVGTFFKKCYQHIDEVTCHAKLTENLILHLGWSHN
jgi:hypothetical protein